MNKDWNMDDQTRATLAALADAIAPRYEKMPSATEIDLMGAPIDRVLTLRSDLHEPLLAVMSNVSGMNGPEAMAFLEKEDPAGLHVILTIVAGAYYAHPAVRAALHYSGQQAQTLPRAGFGAEELVVEMMEQPSRYRQTS